MVLPNPLTLALMRVVWRLASICQTSLVGMPLAWAMLRMGVGDFGVVSFLGVLKMGWRKTGPMAMRMIVRTRELQPAPQIHQVFGKRRTMAKRTTMAMDAMTTRDQQRLEFVAHPRAEGLRGHAVLVLAYIVLVVLEREAENGDNDGVQDGSTEAAAASGSG